MMGRLPLEGIRVVDLTIWQQGPVAAQILADLGAEVIKIEKPGQGDFARGTVRWQGTDLTLPDGRSLLWEMLNRNKKGIAVDMRHSKGREVVYRLVRKADVMLTNLLPAALREMGADEETILTQNPRIIYARASGFGTRGPYAEDPCSDPVGLARSGFMFLNSGPEGDPVYTAGGLSDVLSGTMLAFGVVTSLLAKERTGRAAAVYASQLSTMMWQTLTPVAVAANLGQEYLPYDRMKVAQPLANIYKCADGRWIALGIWVSDLSWHTFCEAMELEHLEHDERFATEAVRAEHHQELIRILDKTFASQPRAEWERRFRERGLWCSIVNRHRDLPADPQVQANEYLFKADSSIQMVSLPFELDGVKLPRRAAPEHGQDTDQVLQETCGYTWDEVVELKADGAVW